MKISFFTTAILSLALFLWSCKVTKSPGQAQPGLVHGSPPLTWKEHWFEHNQLVKRVYYDDHVAVYYDDDVNRSLTWPFKTMSDVWGYVKKTYGQFGDSSRLYVILHQGRYGGGHPRGYFDPSHDFRNTLDCGLSDWSNPTGERIGIPVHEIGQIVTFASHNTKGSPSDAIWGDSKFMEIFNYDVYRNIGMDDEAKKLLVQMETQVDNFPRPGTQWFKNWFYPIYERHGKAAVLNKYFAVLADNFTKDNDNRFVRDLNFGEFIHFWSGAAGANLKAQATLAFGWPAECEIQFKQAQKDFPNVKYPND
jgi:hypothetical protein